MSPGASRPFPLGILWPVPRWIARGLLLLLFRLLIGLRIEGLDRLPRTGPVIVVANHLHLVDPILVAAASPRPLHYMAKKELFEVPVVGFLLRRAGCFPVDRGKVDRAALRTASDKLDRGIALGMFPEGTRSTSGALKPALAGAGLLALRSAAPVVPVAITGTDRLPFNGSKGGIQRRKDAPKRPRRSVCLRFGEPFVVSRERDGRAVSAHQAKDQIMVRIAAMLPDDYRGVYADGSSV